MTVKDFADAAQKSIEDFNRFSARTRGTIASLNRFAASPGLKAVSEAVARLNQMPTRAAIDIPALNTKLARIPPRPEIGLLKDLHSQLQGMANLLTESRAQTAEMVEVTKANLTAALTVVEELRETRKASDRWNRTAFLLTIAIFAATVVAAIAVGPAFVQQITHLWSWVQSL